MSFQQVLRNPQLGMVSHMVFRIEQRGPQGPRGARVSGKRGQEAVVPPLVWDAAAGDCSVRVRVALGSSATLAILFQQSAIKG